MLEVCAGIAEHAPERLSLMTLIGAKDLSPSLYSAPLKRLVEAGFLEDLGRDQDDHRTRWYGPVETPLWSIAVELSDMPTFRQRTE